MIECEVPSSDGLMHRVDSFYYENYKSNKLHLKISCGFVIEEISKTDVYRKDIFIWLFRIDIGDICFLTRSMSHMKKSFDDTLISFSGEYPEQLIHFDFSHLWSREFMLNTLANELIGGLDYHYYFNPDSGVYKYYKNQEMLGKFEDRLLKDIE